MHIEWSNGRSADCLSQERHIVRILKTHTEVEISKIAGRLGKGGTVHHSGKTPPFNVGGRTPIDRPVVRMRIETCEPHGMVEKV